jgi:hypothetical protein
LLDERGWHPAEIPVTPKEGIVKKRKQYWGILAIGYKAGMAILHLRSL